jgi:hypothetical protein
VAFRRTDYPRFFDRNSSEPRHAYSVGRTIWVLVGGKANQIGVSSLMRMTLNLVERMAEDRDGRQCAGTGGPDSASALRRDCSSEVEAIAVTFESVKR